MDHSKNIFDYAERDLSNDERTKTYQANLAVQPKIPIGKLVEHVETGVRLFVFGHSRDDDGTLLYDLTADEDMLGEELGEWPPKDYLSRVASMAAGLKQVKGLKPQEAVITAKMMIAFTDGKKYGAMHFKFCEEKDLIVIDR